MGKIAPAVVARGGAFVRDFAHPTSPQMDLARLKPSYSSTAFTFRASSGGDA
jgi:hypothetical protein